MDTRRVLLAVDEQPGLDEALALIQSCATGPMADLIAGGKFNDALDAAWGGQKLVDEFYGTYPEQAAMADLKLADIGATNVNRVRHYIRDGKDLILTVSVHTSVASFRALREKFPGVKVAVMGVPTDIPADEFKARYGMSPSEAMEKWYSALVTQYREVTGTVDELPGDYVISSVDMLDMYTSLFPEAKPIVPGVRDPWMDKEGQKRTAGCAEAMGKGAYYIVMGSQLYKGNREKGITAEESRRRTAETLNNYFAKAA